MRTRTRTPLPERVRRTPLVTTSNWIQAKKGREEPGLIEHGEIVGFGVNEIDIRIGSEVRHYRTHEISRLAAVLRELGNRVQVQEEWSLLTVPSESGTYCFSVTSAAKWTPCGPDPMFETGPLGMTPL